MLVQFTSRKIQGALQMTEILSRCTPKWMLLLLKLLLRRQLAKSHCFRKIYAGEEAPSSHQSELKTMLSPNIAAIVWV